MFTVAVMQPPAEPLWAVAAGTLGDAWLIVQANSFHKKIFMESVSTILSLPLTF